jgi:hypothetical protein
MKNHAKMCVVAGGLLFANIQLFADEKPVNPLNLSGYASFEESELVKGYLNLAYGTIQGSIPEPMWMENAKIGVIAKADVGEHLQIITALEGKLGFSLTTDYNPQEGYLLTELPHTEFTIQRGEGLYSFGDPQKPSLQIEAGYFPYKYNPDVRDLGEYLFRSFCYPPSLLNTFDRPYADLLGLRVGNSIALPAGVFHHDLIFTSETKYYPLKDFSLSYLADYSLSRILSVGVGVCLYRLLPVFLADSANTKTPQNAWFDSATGDSGYYTFSGTKLMARASFDIKGLVPMDFFGEEDLKLYGEVAVLGLKNYPRYYDNLSQRIPVMLGFNIPVFGLLNLFLPGFTRHDLFKVELEYQGTDVPNGIYRTFYPQYYGPIPDSIPGVKRTMLKWSLYANKKIGSHLSLIGQIANDHLMPDNYNIHNQYQPLTDVTLRANDWWWVVKVRFDY